MPLEKNTLIIFFFLCTSAFKFWYLNLLKDKPYWTQILQTLKVGILDSCIKKLFTAYGYTSSKDCFNNYRRQHAWAVAWNCYQPFNLHLILLYGKFWQLKIQDQTNVIYFGRGMFIILGGGNNCSNHFPCCRIGKAH